MPGKSLKHYGQARAGTAILVGYCSLDSAAEGRNGKPGTYKKIKEEVERIHGEGKKQRILTFIKP